MAIQSSTLSYFQELEALKDTDEETNKAFMDLLVYAILADERITDDELEQLDEELMRLPFLWDGAVRERVVAHSAETRERLESIVDDPDAMQEFLDETAARVTERDHQLVVLRMVTAIALSDGLEDMEREKIFLLGNAFDVDDAEIEELIEDVAEHML